jgi:hypothetical protein
MEERELTQLLQRLGDRVTPSPAPVQRIVDAGAALRGRRSGRVRMFAVAATAAAVVGGGSVAAVVLDLPSGGDSGMSADSAGGSVDDAGSGGAGEEAAPQAGSDSGTDEGAAAADTVDAVMVAPDVVSPGDEVQVTARDDRSSFGLAWRLERRTADGGWIWEYTLTAPLGAEEPAWVRAGEGLTARDRPAEAPLTLLVPPVAAPGDYRVCQMDGAADLCGLLTVTG